MRTIIHRYVLREILGPFWVGLCVFTSVLLLARLLKLIELVVNRGLPVTHIAWLVGCLLPALVEVAAPMALLLAILVAFGRLSADTELVALRSSGVSLTQLLPPLAVAVALVTLLTAGVSMYARPWGARSLRTMLFEVARVRASAGLKARVFNEDFPDVVLYAEEFDPTTDRLRHIMIADERDPRQPNTVFAREGVMISDPETHSVTLRLEDGWIHTADGEGRAAYETDFVTYDVSLDLRQVLADGQRQSTAPPEMALPALRRHLAAALTAGVPDRPALVEFHRRWVIPLACPVLALIAVPLAVKPARAVRSRGFAVSLAVVFVYYVLLSVGQGMAEEGRVPVALGLWLPNIAFLAAGLVLFTRANRELPPLSAPLARWLEPIRATFARRVPEGSGGT